MLALTSPVPSDQAIAPQSLMVAVCTSRSVVAMTWKFGNSFGDAGRSWP